MVVAAAREIRDGDVVFVGMRLPLIAFRLAKMTHAPRAFGVFENGLVRGTPSAEFLYTMSDTPNVVGAHMCTRLSLAMSLLGRGRIDLGFIGGAEVDRFGNMILTRLPVLQAFRHLLPWPADPEVPSMQRVAVEVVLQAPWGPLRVTTTHLEYYSARQRAAQVERLRELQAEAAAHAQDVRHSRKEGGPFENAARPASGILTADFNFRPDDPLYARLQAPFVDATPRYVDGWEIMHPGAPHAPTLGVFDREQWPEPFACDFIFVTEDLVCRVREVLVNSDTDASDHQPVLLSLD